MAIVILPTPLAARIDRRGPLTAAGPTAGEVVGAIEREHPALEGWILDEKGNLRQHVSLFVNDERADLDKPVGDNDEIFVIQAISGGSRPDSSKDEGELLVGTKKGLIVLTGRRGEPMSVAHRAFPGQVVEYACHDPRSGIYYASVTHGQFGPHLYFTADPTGEWEEARGPAFPADADAAVDRIWVIEPAADDGALWAGVAPAALFRSEDAGRTWELNRALWNDPSRPRWEAGFGGLCLHSIAPWPGEPDRLAVGISAAGIWLTDDRGESWRRGVEGLVPGYLPEEARQDTLMHCIHKIQRPPLEPTTLYMQFHGGVYRSDDAGETWMDIGAEGGLPADFGFPMAIDPADPDRAFVIPLASSEDRVTPEGKVRVFETRDRGATWQALSRGLPQQDAYLTVLRQAFCQDGRDPLGLYFGCRTGEVFGSADGGESWGVVADRLPPVLSVQASK
ncbi:MAG: MoaD/ThiS family protein [Thermoanaerobaculia bacterium]